MGPGQLRRRSRRSTRVAGLAPSRLVGVGLLLVLTGCASPAPAGTPSLVRIAQATDAYPLPSAAPPVPCTGCDGTSLFPPLDRLAYGRVGACDAAVAHPDQCVVGGDGPKVALMGDPFAESWLAAFDYLGKVRGWSIINLASTRCPAVPVRVTAGSDPDIGDDCLALHQQQLDRLALERPELVVIADGYAYDLLDEAGRTVHGDLPRSEAWDVLWASALTATIGQVASAGARVVVLGGVPTFANVGLDPIGCVGQSAGAFERCSAVRDDVVDVGALALEQATAIAAGAAFIDPTDWLCDPTSCPAVIGTTIVYLDRHGRLTSAAAVSLAGALYDAITHPTPGPLLTPPPRPTPSPSPSASPTARPTLTLPPTAPPTPAPGPVVTPPPRSTPAPGPVESIPATPEG